MSQVITKELVLSKCKFLVDVQLWAIKKRIDPEGWLSNFKPEELPHALSLLNGFMYFSGPTVDELFRGAFRKLSQIVVKDKDSLIGAQAEWRNFLRDSVVTRVTGEEPSDADSGFLFARKARDLIGFPEDRIVDSAEALRRMKAGALKSIIFVDDFVGSGNQFVTLWSRRIPQQGAPDTSFSDEWATRQGVGIFYCSIICCDTGKMNISTNCPNAILSPAHFINEEYCALRPNAFFWDKTLGSTATNFLEVASRRAGIPDNNGNVGDWRGFHRLGLALAFEHGVPDATLPMLSWNRNGWKPLVKPA